MCSSNTLVTWCREEVVHGHPVYCNRLSNLPDLDCNDFLALRKHRSLSRNIQVYKKPLYSSLLVKVIQRSTLQLNEWSLLTYSKVQSPSWELTGLQLVKKFPAFYGTRRFITALTSVRHLSLSWASPIKSTYTHPTSWKFILILSTHLRLGLPSGLFPSGFPTKTLYTPFSSPIHETCPAHQIEQPSYAS